jgi:CHASE3 domain sensor protein
VSTRGGLTRRMVVASGLLAIVVGAAFAVLLSSVADLRSSERRARQSEEVLVVANQLERLVVDVETSQRGFVITGQERFLRPWRDARAAFPGQAGTLERLVAGSAEQEERARAITRAGESYVQDYSVPLVSIARGNLAAARTEALTDEGKRRIDGIRVEFDRFVATERDLHDGTQQRLVSLALDLRAAEAAVPPELPELRVQLARVAEGLAGELDELREISRGIHPAILSEGGLGPALKALARRSAVPVELDVPVVARLPEPVEVAAYYVVSEALANAAKHAHASVVQVEARARDGALRLTVRDDGVGGAVPGQGSGLIGLTDRVEALGGTISIASPSGQGTTLQVDLPVGDR